MVVVHLDVRLTRRKRFHIATDASGEVLYTSQQFRAMMRWLAEQDDTELVLRDGDEEWPLAVERS